MVMYIDLDEFKKINDTLRYNYGDAVIQEVAARLKEHVRASDTIARLGMDEFAIILYEIVSDFGINKLSTRLINKISQPILFTGSTLQVTASIGISQLRMDVHGAEELINSADQSMCFSQENGKNRFTLSTVMAH
jgi:diguanylate cyclase (GGDEF)-like protein